MHKVLFILLGGLMLAAVSPADNAPDASALAGLMGEVQPRLLQKQCARSSGGVAAGETTTEEAASKMSQNALARKVGGAKTRLLYQLRHRYQKGTPAAAPAGARLSML